MEVEHYDIWCNYEAECQGCDMWGPDNDVGLCDACAGKLERDLIRKREWAYSATAFGCPKDKLENLRNDVIQKYGKKYELIAGDKTSPKKAKRNRGRNRKK